MARNDTEKSLKPRQRQAIAALLTEPTLTKAAEAAGVARVTLNRWLRDDPDFIAELIPFGDKHHDHRMLSATL